MRTVRTRFAPSPTGYLHIGSARTALFCWLHARHTGGEYVVRVEDTDLKRSTEEATQVVLESLDWMGLTSDQPIIYQTQRFDRYKEVVNELLEAGLAYKCYATPEELKAMREEQMARKQKPRYDGRWRDCTDTPPAGVDPVIRFKNPQSGDVVVNDLVYGEIKFKNTELDDLIIARSDGVPTYNLTVVVDDHDTEITTVIRGDDHINNTPRQINIYKALGWDVPEFGHLPMILGEDGAKLSKRHGAVSVLEYRELGYLPDALLNYLVRLGWSHGEQEIFSREEMIKLFDIHDANRSAARMNMEKFAWVNQQHIQRAKPDELREPVTRLLAQRGVTDVSTPPIEDVIAAQQERSTTLAEMADKSVFFYQDFTEFDAKSAKAHLRPVALESLQAVREALAKVSEWKAEPLHEAIHGVVEAMQLKLGKVAQPVRVAVSGGSISPSIDVTLELLGRDKSLARLDTALAFIAKRAEAA